MDSREPDSILGDREADKAMQRIDYDFDKLRMRRRDQKSAAVRAKAYDGWVRRFLDSCSECTVLHLGCGLDTRVYRVNPASTVRWYDIDLPDVIELRRRLFPERPGVHTIAASVTDPHLLDDIRWRQTRSRRRRGIDPLPARRRRRGDAAPDQRTLPQR